MKVKSLERVEIKFDDFEKEMIKKVDEIFVKYQNIFSIEDTLISEDTGEIIKIEEIPRFRGILTGILSSKNWSVEKTEN